jgi:uncharacterized protein
MQTQFISEQGNSYWYSPKLKSFLYLPEDLSLCVSRQSGQKRDDYYERKFKFLAEHHCFDDHRTEFQPEYDPEMVRQNLANLRQLLIEVTDDCNLKCHYCGYGEFYSNYDQRCTRNQTFDNVKLLIDALAAYWKGPYNLSHYYSAVCYLLKMRCVALSFFTRICSAIMPYSFVFADK